MARNYPFCKRALRQPTRNLDLPDDNFMYQSNQSFKPGQPLKCLTLLKIIVLNVWFYNCRLPRILKHHIKLVLPRNLHPANLAVIGQNCIVSAYL